MKNSPLNLSNPVKLLISVGGIYTSYIYFGLITERLFNKDYSGLNRPSGTYEKFSYGFATSLFQNILSFILAYCVRKYYCKQLGTKIDLKSEVLMGTCSFGTTFLTNQALAYVTFPVQALMKSSKIIAILLVSFLMGYKSQHTKSQYFCGIVITGAIILFNLTNNNSHGQHGQFESGTSIMGIMILVLSLFCDGLLGTTQSEVKRKFNPNQWDQMESLNKWAGIVCFAISTITFQMGAFLKFVYDHPLVLKDLALLAILGTFGQVFVFYTLANFSPLILSIISTTRKFVTVLASIAIYHHAVNGYQWIAIVLVFLGVGIEVFSGRHRHDENPHAILPMQDDEDIEAKAR